MLRILKILLLLSNSTHFNYISVIKEAESLGYQEDVTVADNK